MINKNKTTINPVAAAVTGAVIGAGVAVAGAIALKDEKNQTKVKKALHEAKEQATDYMAEIKKTVGDKEILKEKLAEGANKLQEAAIKAKKHTHTK